jgi:RNA polymerase sigma-70 factor (ECF subfamily)
MVSGSEAVDDLAQEVFIRAYRSIGDFKGESSLYTWLYKIALNLCRNHYRTRGRRPVHEQIGEDGSATVLEAEGGSPEDEAVRREFWEELRRGLARLPEEQREAVVLCDLEGMSYEEMAEVMGVPIGTVRSRIFRGRRALQERLAAFHAAAPRATTAGRAR